MILTGKERYSWLARATPNCKPAHAFVERSTASLCLSALRTHEPDAFVPGYDRERCRLCERLLKRNPGLQEVVA